jgi:hypothetical protein
LTFWAVEWSFGGGGMVFPLWTFFFGGGGGGKINCRRGGDGFVFCRY